MPSDRREYDTISKILSKDRNQVQTLHKRVLRKLTIQENQFGFEQEITCKISANGWRVIEIPISYYGRTYAEGKKITWKDGLHGF